MYEARQNKEKVRRVIGCVSKMRQEQKMNAKSFFMHDSSVGGYISPLFSSYKNTISLKQDIRKSPFLCVQRVAPPSTKERTKAAIPANRHNIPHPFMDLGVWYKTLMIERVADLYRTAGGFLGHAAQIQQELNRFIPLIEDNLFLDSISLQTALEYERKIRNFIVNQAKHTSFDFPKFIFGFSGNSKVAVEKTNGRFIGG